MLDAWLAPSARPTSPSPCSSPPSGASTSSSSRSVSAISRRCSSRPCASWSPRCPRCSSWAGPRWRGSGSSASDWPSASRSSACSSSAWTRGCPPGSPPSSCRSRRCSPPCSPSSRSANGPAGSGSPGMGVALAGIGVAAVDEGASGPLLGFTLVVVAAVGWGVSNVLTRKAAPSDPFTFMVWTSAVPVLPLLALSLTFEGWDRDTQALASLDLDRRRHHRVRRLGHHALRLRRLELPAAQPPRLVGRPVHAARPGVRDVVRRALPRRERQPPALVRRRAARRRRRPRLARARSPEPGRPACGHSGARAARRGP